MAHRIKLTITGRENTRRAADRHRVRPMDRFMKVVGRRIAEDVVGRLPEVLRSSGNVQRTGRLMASWGSAGPGGGSADSFWEHDHLHVKVGTTLHYANQVNFGGPIRPKPGNRALAIPFVPPLPQAGEIRPDPIDLDPNREVLVFLKARESGKGIGVLIDPENRLGYGTRPLFWLTGGVNQPGRRFAFIDEEAKRDITGPMYRRHLGTIGE